MHPVSNPGKGLGVEINVHSQLDILGAQQTSLLGMRHGKLGAGYVSAMTWFIAPDPAVKTKQMTMERYRFWFCNRTTPVFFSPTPLSN